MKKLFFIFIVLYTFSSAATVNMRNGSYSESWIDFIDPDKGVELKIERFYSSRSVYTGIFGFGWCTFLESRLTVTSDGIVNLTECGGGLEITYYPKDFDLKSPQDTIRRIVDDYKKKKKMSTGDIANLRTQLKNNTKMRFEYANKLGLINIQKIKTKNNTFYAKSKGVENITFNGQFYERKRFDGRIERYDQNGKLIQITNKAGHWIKLNYKGRRIAYLVDKKGRRLNFSYDKSGKLSRIYNGRNLEIKYQFEGDNLKSVINMWKKKYIYHYDSNHNLIQVDFPDKTAIKMSYNVQKDWIKSYTNRLNCVENFDFLLAKDDPHNHYWGVHSIKCPKSPKFSGRHEFWYKKYSFSNDKYLHRVREEYRNQFKDIYYHPYLGQPVTIRENFEYKGFAYFLNGLINKREYKLYTTNRDILKWNKTSFIYDFDLFRVTETNITELNKLGKVSSRNRLKFKYNRNGLLETATDQKGRHIKISYDENGKISRLKDHQKTVLRFNYKVGVKKPYEIEQVGIGKVSITYDLSGNIKNVEFAGQRNVSSSVVEKFLEMIEFLGPMGEKLKI